MVSSPIDLRERPLIPVDQVAIRPKHRGDLAGILVTDLEIRNRISELARDIYAQHGDKEVLGVCILNGAVCFYSDMIRAMQTPVEAAFFPASSYGKGTVSSGEVGVGEFDYGLVPGRRVLLFEDIVETGRTMQALKRRLEDHDPVSVEVVALFDKPTKRAPGIELRPDYNGFVIGDPFIVGFGLDCANRYRELPHVGVLKPGVYE